MPCCARSNGFSFALSVLAAVALLSVAFWQTRVSGQDDAPSQAAPPTISLHDHMEEINDHLRALMRGLPDAAMQGENLAHVAELQRHLVAAKNLPAPGLDDQPEPERATYALGFRKALAEVLIEVGKLELDVIDGRSDEATKRIRENLIEMRNAAHERYQVDG